MLKKIVIIWILFFAIATQAQTYTKHTVTKGETINQIAQKYKVTPYDIYRINPDSQNGLKPDAVLLIPSSTVQTSVPITNTTYSKTHQVVAKETVFGIAKQYETTVDQLNKVNPTLQAEGLKIGQIINIPKKTITKSEPKIIQKSEPKVVVKEETKTITKSTTSTKAIFHEVLPKETKYSIAKKYGLTVSELEKQNPEIVSNLTIGFKLKMNSNGVKKEVLPVVSENKIIVPKPSEIKQQKPVEYTDYEIKSKETLYSLSRKFSIKQDDLLVANPDLKNGVREGMTIKVPSTASLNSDIKKQFTDLSKSIKQTSKKQLAILLPFNISKIEGDTINSQQQRLKKDGFLNMTLDFYAGALVAIDSAKTLGINIDIKILDSQETKYSSNVENIVKQNNLQNYNAIIGPFYQTQVDKVAALLEKNNIPLISPLSKDVGKPYNNSYASMPSSDFAKEAMFDFMREKNGNIIAVIDAKKGMVKQYISENQKDTKFATLDEKGSLVTESLKNLLVKDKINYVVMAAERTGMIMAITNTLINALSDFQIRLVILEPNETLDFEEIALSRLTKLKLTYPSLTRENETEKAKIFENEFKKKNKIFPSQYATRGFDITFDTLLRLAQSKTFEETINDSASEQVENKFDYSKKISGGYINKGVYILQYNSDLTISNAE